MKVKLNELKPNPYKKNISGGRLDEDTVKRIQSNIKELGLMGALPVFKRDNKYFLVAGHHRKEALKREFGKDYQVSVEVHNYNDDQILRGMVIENLTQRANEFREEAENLKMIREHLRKNPVQQVNTVATRKDGRKLGDNQQPEPGSISEINNWLNKNGDVMSRGKISQILKITDTVDPEILERIEKVGGGKAPENVVTTKQAIELSKIEDKKEQREFLEAMKREESGRPHELGSKYRDAPEEVKEQVRKGIINLSDIDLAIISHNQRELKNNKPQIIDIAKKINGLIDRLSFSISDSESKLKEVLKDMVVLSKYTKDMNERHKARTSSKLNRYSNMLAKLSNMINSFNEKIEDE